MPNGNQVTQAICWHEGMMLAPQHFQQQSLRLEELIHYHCSINAPFHWGVQKLLIDHTLLVEGVFRILSLECIMPDGLIACHGDKETDNLEIDLTQYLENIEDSIFTIYICVSANTLGSGVKNDDSARYYSVSGNPVYDETGDSEILIPRLVPRIKLIVSDKIPSAKYTSFPLCKIKLENDIFVMTNYLAPVLEVSHCGTDFSKTLWDICSSITRRLREKAAYFSSMLNSTSSTVRGPLPFEIKMMIRALVASLPYFEAVLNTGKSHPYILYLALCSLAGNIAAGGRKMIPPVFTPYNQNTLRFCFEEVSDYIFRIIDEDVSETYTMFTFDYKNGTFELELKDYMMSRILILGVKQKSGKKQQDVHIWMNECLIGSSDHIELMKQNRIIGLDRHLLEEVGELIPARGTVFYAVRANPKFITENKMLQIINSSDLPGKRRPSEIKLFVKNKV